MGDLLNLMTPFHKQTKRDYLARMNDSKPYCMEIAKQYGFDYWDGDRRFGYGGYKPMPEKWRPIATELIKHYKIQDGMKILDVGCGKGYLLQAFRELLPKSELVGFDISEYAIKQANDTIDNCLLYADDAGKPSAWGNLGDMEFDVAISLG